MVATLVRLRFLLLANSLKKSPWQIVAVVLGGLYGLGVLVALIAGLIGLSFAPPELARTVVVLGGAALILGWTVIPTLTSGIDQTVEPARLATFPIPVNTLLVGLTVSGLLGVPGIVTLVAAIGTGLTWWHTPGVAIIAVVCAVIGVLTAVIGSRMLVAVTAGLASGRRVREAKGILLFIPLVLAGPIVLGLIELFRGSAASLPAVANGVAWTPIGAVWAIPSDVAAGDLAQAGLRLLIAFATLAVFAGLWRWGLARALETPVKSSSMRAGNRGLGLFGVFRGTPAGAVAARALTYWIRDPRYAQSLITVPLVPVLLFFYASVNDNFLFFSAVGPIIAVLLAMSIYTDVSYDNTAFALHLQTGVSGRADRIGRVLALAVFAVPISIALTIASVAITDTWQVLPGLLAITVGVLLTGFGLSSLISGWMIFAVPAPGESPFKSKPGGGFSLMISLFVTWSLLGILILPEFVLAMIGIVTGQAMYGWIALAVALALGSVLLVLGIRIGGRILDQRGPDLLVKLQQQK